MGKTIEVFGFPTSVSDLDVKVFVERYTGEGTVYDCKLRTSKGQHPRAIAIIQFTTAKDVASIISLANNGLYYGNSYLNVRELEKDVVPTPRSFLHSFEKAKLHFGCQLSKEKFSVLWNAVDVDVNFGIGMRKLYFFLSYGGVEYKLQLSYENIWQIEMFKPRGGTARYLLFQVWFLIFFFDSKLCARFA
ncbi:hypothetical protein L6164_001464 [Bauhinia variegata]|uniref:Uncharacterized protein n=1 Tax=Bauhinia variegata TaxID=167791 RepID=A0ACB9Q9G5_BAUVA|nr:hypothetical protein L6164_001464 [Bauhinia variegata]